MSFTEKSLTQTCETVGGGKMEEVGDGSVILQQPLYLVVRRSVTFSFFSLYADRNI